MLRRGYNTKIDAGCIQRGAPPTKKARTKSWTEKLIDDLGG